MIETPEDTDVLTGRRTVFIPAALRVVTSSCVNQVDLVERHQLLGRGHSQKATVPVLCELCIRSIGVSSHECAAHISHRLLRKGLVGAHNSEAMQVEHLSQS